MSHLEQKVISDIAKEITSYNHTSILLGKIWDAHPHWYDYINQINLAEGRMCLGGGQAVNMECKVETTLVNVKHYPYEPQSLPLYNYEKCSCVEEGEIKIKYIEDENSDVSPTFTNINRYRWYKYKVYKGNFILEGPYCVYRASYKVEFENNPMPEPQVWHLFRMISPSSVFKQVTYHYVNSEEPSYKENSLPYYTKYRNEVYRNTHLQNIERLLPPPPRYFKYIEKHFPYEI